MHRGLSSSRWTAFSDDFVLFFCCLVGGNNRWDGGVTKGMRKLIFVLVNFVNEIWVQVQGISDQAGRGLG